MNPKRMIAAFSMLCIFATALYLRIAFIMSDDFYIETAKSQSSYTLTIPASRGLIYDSELNPLVRQKMTYQAAVLLNENNFETVLSHAQGVTREDLLTQMRTGKPFVCTLDTYQINDPNCIIFPGYDRDEEKGTVRHIVGYCKDGTGVSGIEKAYDSILSAKDDPTKITYELDGIGKGFTDRSPEINYGRDAKSGVILTIDQEIQQLCEKIGRETIEKGAIVVMETKTGKLKAMCSFPEYSLNDLQAAVSDEENTPFLDRTISPFNVGSTFKVVTSASALSLGISSGETYTCTGAYDLNGTVFRCHDHQGHGTLDLKGALMASCNPYFIHLGQKVTPSVFLKTASDLSFGKQFELAPGLYTQSGSLPTSVQLEDPGQLANFSFGQGYLTATPVQIAQMFSSVGNEGFTPNPILVEGTTTDGKTVETTAKTQGVQAMTKEIAQTIKEDLTACVMEKENQKSTPKTTTAAGKTATAQTGIFDDSGEELCNGWFGGFFPAEDPKYTVVVLAEQAGEGSLVAAPIFAQIVDGINLIEGLS